MCKETPDEVFAMAKAEQERHMRLMNSRETKGFDQWWHGKIWGWFDAAQGDLARTRKFLGLPPCNCGNNATK